MMVERVKSRSFFQNIFQTDEMIYLVYLIKLRIFFPTNHEFFKIYENQETFDQFLLKLKNFY